MERRPLGAQISHALAARGVTTVFGIPGVHNIELYRGIEEAGIDHVLARHEQGAGFMADGYARATGKPGVAYVISGPGVTNILTPVGQAASDGVPLLVVASCLDDSVARRGQLHQMRDQAGAARAVARWSEVAADAKAAAVLLDRAFAGFAAARPGPCVMHVPISALGETAGPLPPPSAVPARPAADPAIVEEVAARIRAAERPLFVFGGGAARSGATASARRVLALAGAAAFTTYAGRGVVAPDWPLLFGSFLARPDSSAVVASADLVVAVGTELSEVDLWRPQLGHACPLVRVDLDPEVLADDHRADLPVLADAAGFLAALEAALSGNRPATGWRPAEVAEARARWRAQADAERPGILPVIDALRAAVPSAATIFSDMTQFAYLAKEVWDMPAPGRWHHPFGFGTLGYALPAAIGGKIGLGAQPVVAIAGDHGLQYTLPELAVAVERGLSLPIIVWDNGKLKEIEDCMIDAQMSPRATTARNPDFLALARAYGARAAEPKGAAGIRAAMAEALAAPVPTLIRLTPESLGGAPG